MITEIQRKSYTARPVAAGEDMVIASMPIPPGGVFRGFRAEIHGVANSSRIIQEASAVYAKAVIVPMGGSMMDTALSLQTLFDQMVPKDVDLNIGAGADDIDWDDGAIATPFEEPGQINWGDLVELGQRPLGILERSEFISFAKQGRFPHVDTTDQWVPTFSMRIGSNRKIRVKQASYFFLALASPSWDEVTTTEPVTIVDANWSALTYPDVMFDMMLPDILGLTEAGAVSPYSDMATFALDLVEPLVFEAVADDFRANTYQTRTKWECRVLTPGRPQMKMLSGGMP